MTNDDPGNCAQGAGDNTGTGETYGVMVQIGMYIFVLAIMPMKESKPEMKCSLDSSQLNSYCRQHQAAMNFNTIAANDYIACRCCLINKLFGQGYVLAEQAIEKQLKSIIKILSPSENLRKKPYRQHNLVDLVNRVNELGLTSIIKFGDFASTLTNIYELTRYPDSNLSQTIKSYSMSTAVVKDIDEMFFELLEISPMAIEAKFRSGIFPTIFDANDFFTPMSVWATCNNVAFEVRWKRLAQVYEGVRNHLYPNQSLPPIHDYSSVFR